MYTLENLLSKLVNGKSTLLLIVLANIIYLSMLLVTIPNTVQYAGGMDILDMMPAGYDASYVNSLLDQLGVEGRNYYSFRQIPIDMVYPALFACAYNFLIFYLLRRSNLLHAPQTYLLIFPILAGIFDYLENFGILLFLHLEGNHDESLVGMISSFTIAKSISTMIVFTSILILLVVWMLKSIQRKRFIHRAELGK